MSIFTSEPVLALDELEGKKHMNKETDCTGRIDASGWEGAEDTDPRLDLSAFDVAGAGPMSFAVVCDSGEHPDRRVPYRVSVEAGVAIEDVEPIGMVS